MAVSTSAHRPQSSAARKRASARSRAAGSGLLAPLAAYARESRSHWAAFWFILPLLALHELGVAWYAGIPSASEQRVTAFVLMCRFFENFGATGRFLPALALLIALLAAHRADPNRSWRLGPATLPLMAVESLLWALPLVGVYWLISPAWLIVPPAGTWPLSAAMCLGAGVYEEAAFRLVGFAVLSFLLVDLGKFPVRPTVCVMVSTVAALFSAYHLLGDVSWPWPAFVLIGLRGIYYGVIYLERGFGVTVGFHAAYDLMILAASGVVGR